MKTEFKNFAASIKKAGKKESLYGTPRKQHHVLTISKGGQVATFDYWTSDNQPNIESETDVKHAVHCTLMDAVASCENLTAFCHGFGYTQKDGAKVYRECVKTYKKLEKIGIDEDAANDILMSAEMLQF
jgi:hypothetical protein